MAEKTFKQLSADIEKKKAKIQKLKDETKAASEELAELKQMAALVKKEEAEKAKAKPKPKSKE